MPMVLSLVQSGRLIDALTNTQDPNTDADSPAEQGKCYVIRKDAAASVVGLIGKPGVTTDQEMNTLFLLCKDANADVKTAAKAGLQKLGRTERLHPARHRRPSRDGDPDIRGAAVDVLGLIGNDPGFGDKTATLVNGVLLDPTSQDSAETAMQKIGGPAAPFLTAHLDDPGATIEFRQKMVDLLGQIGTVSTLKPLTRMSQADQPPSVQREAKVSLANIVLADYTAEQKAVVAAQTAAKDPKAKPADVQKAQ